MNYRFSDWRMILFCHFYPLKSCTTGFVCLFVCFLKNQFACSMSSPVWVKLNYLQALVTYASKPDANWAFGPKTKGRFSILGSSRFQRGIDLCRLSVPQGFSRGLKYPSCHLNLSYDNRRDHRFFGGDFFV